MSRLLVTGGAGFIGANFVHYTLANHPSHEVTVIDALTYAANPRSLERVSDRMRFVEGDVCDAALLDRLVVEHDTVVHFAAESHVDNSLADPQPFIHSNIVGTYTILEAVRRHGTAPAPHLHRRGLRRPGARRSAESSPSHAVRPVEPLLGSKASSDMLVRAWVRSFGIAATISNCSNNYGPYQHIEKFIPRQVTSVLSGDRPKLYGTGENVREWTHVDDHNAAVHRDRSRTGASARPT